MTGLMRDNGPDIKHTLNGKSQDGLWEYDTDYRHLLPAWGTGERRKEKKRGWGGGAGGHNIAI